MTNVATSAFYDSAIQTMGSLQTRANTLQQQISTGNKILTSSQDPVAAAQMRALQSADTLASADTANANAAQTSLNLADTTLTQITNTITQIHTLATQAASGTLTDTQRAQIGTQVSSLYQNLLSLANTRDANGHAIFAGQGAGAAYAVAANGSASYAGTGSAGTLPLGNGLSVSSGVTGPQVFSFTSGGTTTDLLSVVQSLAAGLQGTGGATPQASASAALDQLSAGLNQVSTAQTMVGANLSWLATTNTISTQLAQQRSQQEATVGGTDIASTVSQLQQTMTVLQASQASFVKLANMSLFSLLG